jgi:hypothetical protein
VVVASIYQCDIHVGSGESLGARKSAESAADDHNATLVADAPRRPVEVRCRLDVFLLPAD